ncbi:MAG: GTP cyclohydrolase [Marinoscillum sp.]|nr:GTP cyclohydrolase [Marinoscillum sp.]OUX27284.1 MAG: GTP cyclohydrolase [Flammeovirgaceae bacterium TMED262]|tara:strand:- start:11088 stop:11690 length:603 start_codon:yes stop_codon:yes gene_type:complete
MKNIFKLNYLLFAVLTLFVFTACEEDEAVPEEEDEMEVITDVTLIFTPDAGDVVTATAQDPDGEGVLDLVVQDEIKLQSGTSYTLTFDIMNNLESPGEDIGDEIAEEDDEHQVFFAWTEGAFSNPSGNGNIDNASDPVNYNDSDGNGNPLGLNTSWTASNPTTAASFTVRLQHQPDVKTATSGANDGDTDFELQFRLTIE